MLKRLLKLPNDDNPLTSPIELGKHPIGLEQLNYLQPCISKVHLQKRQRLLQTPKRWWKPGLLLVLLKMQGFWRNRVLRPQRGYRVKGLARVESHLDDVLNNQFGDLSRSTGLKFQAGERGMLEPLRSGATSPQDIEFYMHELKESARFPSGDLMKAHNEALQWRGVTSQDLFHPEVMKVNPQIFGGRP